MSSSVTIWSCPSQKLDQFDKIISIYGGLRICCMHLFIALNASSIADEGISVKLCSEFSCTTLKFTTSTYLWYTGTPLCTPLFLHLMSELNTYWLWVYLVLRRNALILQSLSVQSCNVNTVDCKHIRKEQYLGLEANLGKLKNIQRYLGAVMLQ